MTEQLIAAECLDRIETYRAWTPECRRGKRLLEIDSGVRNLRAEAEARGYEVASAAPPPAGALFDVCVVGGIFDQTAEPLAAVVRAWELLTSDGTLFMAFPQAGHRSVAGVCCDKNSAESLLLRGGFEHVRVNPGRKRLGTAGGRAAGRLDALARKADAGPVDRRTQTLSVVMPVFNERATFATVATQLLAKQLTGLDLQLIIVESQSTDGTREEVKRFEKDPRVIVIYEDRPRGKGHAVRAGLARASGDFVLIQDADLEYDLDDYEALLEPLRTYRHAFVLGSRHGADGPTWKRRRFTEQAMLGNVLNLAHVGFTLLFNVAYGTRLRDPFTMYKVFRRDCLSGLTFDANRFDFDWELLGKLVRAGYMPVEIPVKYSSRSFTEGKKIRFWIDPLTWVRACVKYRFVRLGK